MLTTQKTGTGFVEVGASVTTATGPQAWLELGARPWERVGVFGRAYAKPGDVGAMVGARVEF